MEPKGQSWKPPKGNVTRDLVTTGGEPAPELESAGSLEEEEEEEGGGWPQGHSCHRGKCLVNMLPCEDPSSVTRFTLGIVLPWRCTECLYAATSAWAIMFRRFF